MVKNEKPILVRVDTDLFAKIEAKRGEKPRAVFIREILTRYLKNIGDTNIDTQSNTIDTQSNTVDTIEHEKLKLELTEKEERLKLSGERVKDLQIQLGFLQQQYSLITQRMLESPEKIKKRWWKFWRRL